MTLLEPSATDGLDPDSTSTLASPADVLFLPGRWHVRYADGTRVPLGDDRWWAPADAVDLDLLRRCADPVLDVGCGPGRMVAALRRLERPALGVDVAPRAVELVREAGGDVVHASVFDELPDEGAWGSVLLADGNIGIGGSPSRLLRRCAQLLAPGGDVVVELEAPGTPTRPVTVRLETEIVRTLWFSWAHVAADRIGEPAQAAGLAVAETWDSGDRWFARLVR